MNALSKKNHKFYIFSYSHNKIPLRSTISVLTVGALIYTHLMNTVLPRRPKTNLLPQSGRFLNNNNKMDTFNTYFSSLCFFFIPNFIFRKSERSSKSQSTYSVIANSVLTYSNVIYSKY